MSQSKRCFTSSFVSFKTVSTTESETTEATTLTTEAQTSPTEPSGKSTLGFRTDFIRLIYTQQANKYDYSYLKYPSIAVYLNRVDAHSMIVFVSS